MTSATPPVERLALLDTITLDRSSHRSFDDGHCAMEVVAWLAGEGHTDAPACVSLVLRTFTIRLNDRWGEEQRQRLVPYLPRMIGTAGDGKDEARSYMALDWLIRSFAPAWLDLAGLSEAAAGLRSLRRIVDMAAAESAGPVVRSAYESAAAVWAAAGAAARAVAWAVARDAARDAAEAAAWAVARDAARDAAEAAFRAAARAAAGAAAWDAAEAAAWAAAWDAAEAAAWDAAEAAAWDAAWDVAWAAARAAALDAARAAALDTAEAAARDALKPTVETLQASALDLLDRMIDGEVR